MMPVKLTVYGGPKDMYHRIEEAYTYRDGEVYVRMSFYRKSDHRLAWSLTYPQRPPWYVRAARWIWSKL